MNRKIIDIIPGCRKCVLYTRRRNMVIGNGQTPADIFCIGEAPGLTEDLRGVAFVGMAGKFLNDMFNNACQLDNTMIRRPSIFLTNTVLCHPCDNKAGQNRPPQAEEVLACTHNVMALWADCQPKAIILIGKIAANYYEKEFPEAYKIQHPSFLLRTGGQKSKYYLQNIRTINAAFKSIRG